MGLDNEIPSERFMNKVVAAYGAKGSGREIIKNYILHSWSWLQPLILLM